MLDLSFGDDPVEEEKPKVDEDKLNRLIGVLQKKQPDGEHAYLIALTFDDIVELSEFIEENALESETAMHRIRKRLENKITLIEKRT